MNYHLANSCKRKIEIYVLSGVCIENGEAVSHRNIELNSDNNNERKNKIKNKITHRAWKTWKFHWKKEMALNILCECEWIALEKSLTLIDSFAGATNVAQFQYSRQKWISTPRSSVLTLPCLCLAQYGVWVCVRVCLRHYTLDAQSSTS